jgi:Tfp pilus assembly pilus retraction ATPase PilT
VVSQRLIPRKDEKGRALAVEVLVGTPETRALLREPEKTGELQAAMEQDAGGTMQTFDQSVRRLLDAEVITAEAALALGVSRVERG